MKKVIFLIVCLLCHLYTIAQIPKDEEIIYGEGADVSFQEARRMALADLMQNLSVRVSSSAELNTTYNSRNKEKNVSKFNENIVVESNERTVENVKYEMIANYQGTNLFYAKCYIDKSEYINNKVNEAEEYFKLAEYYHNKTSKGAFNFELGYYYMTYLTLNEAVILSNSYKASQLYKKAGNMLQPYQSQGFYNSSLRLYMGWDDDMEKRLNSAKGIPISRDCTDSRYFYIRVILRICVKCRFEVEVEKNVWKEPEVYTELGGTGICLKTEYMKNQPIIRIRILYIIRDVDGSPLIIKNNSKFDIIVTGKNEDYKKRETIWYIHH